MKRYFAYDPIDNEWYFYDTKEDAKKRAQEILDGCLDEGWAENTGETCWGEINVIQQAEVTSRETAEEYMDSMGIDPDDGCEFDEYLTYELRDVDALGGTDA